MAQVATVTATIAALAANQAVPHTLVRAPSQVMILEKVESAIKAMQFQRCFLAAGAAVGTPATDVALVGAVMYTVANVMYPAATPAVDFWDITGFDCTQNMYNVALLCVDIAGAGTVGIGTEAATLAGVVLPETPATSCVVATLEVNPTAANFVGGTTLLSAANVNPVYTDVGGHPDGFPEITEGTTPPDATNVYITNSMARARIVQVFCFAPHSIIL